MSDLSDKFENLESQLADQHTALMARLADTNAKLDELITLQGGAPPGPSVTLADVVAAIQATNGILGDVHLDTQSIDQKALTIRDTLSDVHLDTISMDQKLLRIRDAINPLDETLPVQAKSSIPWLLFRIMDAINPTWPRPTSVPLQPAMDLLLALAQMQLPKLSEIDAAIGAPTGDATTTALGILSSIQYSNAGIYQSTGISSGADNTILALLADSGEDCGCASPNTEPDGCSAPYRSGEMALVPWSIIPGYTSLVFARFLAAPPAGLSYGTVFGITADQTELTSDDWTGWRCYVSSDQSQCSINPTSLIRYPCNTWFSMPEGPGDYAWSVADRGGLSVTLCAPGDYSTDCQQISVVGNNAPVITAQITIHMASTVRYVSGSTIVGVYPDAAVGASVSEYTAFVGLTTVDQISDPIPGPYPRVVGLTVGSTSQTVVVEVCPSEGEPA